MIHDQTPTFRAVPESGPCLPLHNCKQVATYKLNLAIIMYVSITLYVTYVAKSVVPDQTPALSAVPDSGPRPPPHTDEKVQLNPSTANLKSYFRNYLYFFYNILT